MRSPKRVSMIPLVFSVSCFVCILFVGSSDLGGSLHLNTGTNYDLYKLGAYLFLSNVLRVVILLYNDSALYRKFFFQACLVFFNVCFYISLTYIFKDSLVWLLSFSMLCVFSNWLFFVATVKKPQISVIPKLAETLESVVVPVESSAVESLLLYNLSDAYLIVRILYFTMVSSRWTHLLGSYRFWLFPFFAARVVVDVLKLVYSSVLIGELEKYPKQH
ncbi:hypothetical protein GpartN1_g3771.t1 [Galdieria partita]|uniref:Uncharacterized protein n=1 Tax=Galdieria partita TaxID=83374 RepID=A0A9C7UQU9_9RHOD|nr:hypothetical protein GpartN1_g3771.t1 [Galdieria partita]